MQTLHSLVLRLALGLTVVVPAYVVFAPFTMSSELALFCRAPATFDPSTALIVTVLVPAPELVMVP